jgi:hypothetical protein
VRFLVLLFVLFMLCGFPAFAACPPGGDCSQDPEAWHKMLGQPDRPTLAAQKDDLAAAIERKFSAGLSRPFHITKLVMYTRGSDYLFCGAGHTKEKPVPIIYETRKDGLHVYGATAASLAKVGCTAPGAIVLR